MASQNVPSWFSPTSASAYPRDTLGAEAEAAGEVLSAMTPEMYMSTENQRALKAHWLSLWRTAENNSDHPHVV